MKKIHSKLRQFFTIENPLLLVSFLLLIIFSRFVTTYFNPSHTVIAPDTNYYARDFVGHDFTFGVTDQAGRLVKGLPMQFDVGYGYSFTVLTVWTVDLLNNFGICHSATDCQFLLYQGEVVLAIGGLILLAFLFIQERNKQAVGLFFLAAFLLGVPGGMGVESGNVDILLCALFGLMLFLQKLSLENKKRYLYPILLGVLAGFMLQTKLFLLPMLLVFLLCSPRPFVFFLSGLAIASFITVIPGIYNAPIDPLYTIQAAHFLQQATNLDSELVYGNNDTRAMVGGLVFAFPKLYSNDSVRALLINVGGGLLFLAVLIAPLFFFRKLLSKKIKRIGEQRLHYSFFILLMCYMVTAAILWPEISLSYRLYYLVPLIYILIDKSQESSTKQFVGLAISALLIRSMFIWHARILHVFLIAFFYFFLMTSLSLWLESKSVRLNKQKK